MSDFKTTFEKFEWGKLVSESNAETIWDTATESVVCERDTARESRRRLVGFVRDTSPAKIIGRWAKLRERVEHAEQRVAALETELVQAQRERDSALFSLAHNNNAQVRQLNKNAEFLNNNLRWANERAEKHSQRVAALVAYVTSLRSEFASLANIAEKQGRPISVHQSAFEKWRDEADDVLNTNGGVDTRVAALEQKQVDKAERIIAEINGTMERADRVFDKLNDERAQRVAALEQELSDARSREGAVDHIEEVAGRIATSHELRMRSDVGMIEGVLLALEQELKDIFWTCPDCAFQMSKEHTNSNGDGGYTCPCCAEQRLEQENKTLLKDLDGYAMKVHVDLPSAVAEMEEIADRRDALERENARLKQIEQAASKLISSWGMSPKSSGAGLEAGFYDAVGELERLVFAEWDAQAARAAAPQESVTPSD